MEGSGIFTQKPNLVQELILNVCWGVHWIFFYWGPNSLIWKGGNETAGEWGVRELIHFTIFFIMRGINGAQGTYF